MKIRWILRRLDEYKRRLHGEKRILFDDKMDPEKLDKYGVY